MGSSSESASREAASAEQARRAQVLATQRQIESIFSDPSRETGIRDVENATRDYLGLDLNRQNDRSLRELRFAMARDGQTMGSRDVDANRAAAEAYLRGGVEVQRRANAAGNSLRQADQASKLNIFSLAQNGLDMTTAARQAGEAMRSNIGMAKADALQTGLGDLFGDLGSIYKRSKEKAGERQAQLYQYGNVFAPNQYYAGGSLAGGGSPWGP
jgi:hypothetical protein